MEEALNLSSDRLLDGDDMPEVVFDCICELIFCKHVSFSRYAVVTPALNKAITKCKRTLQPLVFKMKHTHLC